MAGRWLRDRGRLRPARTEAEANRARGAVRRSALRSRRTARAVRPRAAVLERVVDDVAADRARRAADADHRRAEPVAGGAHRLSRSDDSSTDTLDTDIAAAASIGERYPATASGMHTAL